MQAHPGTPGCGSPALAGRPSCHVGCRHYGSCSCIWHIGKWQRHTAQTLVRQMARQGPLWVTSHRCATTHGERSSCLTEAAGGDQTERRDCQRHKHILKKVEATSREHKNKFKAEQKGEMAKHESFLGLLVHLAIAQPSFKLSWSQKGYSLKETNLWR